MSQVLSKAKVVIRLEIDFLCVNASCLNKYKRNVALKVVRMTVTKRFIKRPLNLAYDD